MCLRALVDNALIVFHAAIVCNCIRSDRVEGSAAIRSLRWFPLSICPAGPSSQVAREGRICGGGLKFTSFRDNGTPGTPLRFERSEKNTPRKELEWVRLRGTGWCPLPPRGKCRGEISCWDRIACGSGARDQSSVSLFAAGWNTRGVSNELSRTEG